AADGAFRIGIVPWPGANPMGPTLRIRLERPPISVGQRECGALRAERLDRIHLDGHEIGQILTPTRDDEDVILDPNSDPQELGWDLVLDLLRSFLLLLLQLACR